MGTFWFWGAEGWGVRVLKGRGVRTFCVGSWYEAWIG